MNQTEFELLLTNCCRRLSEEARGQKFASSQHFENRVREVIAELLPKDCGLKVDFNTPAQGFPDIPIGCFGVEVKFTLQDTWRSVANSVLENQRAPGVEHIYVVFGKMGGTPEVRWCDYESSVVHVRTSHVPRFEVEIPDPSNPRPSLFESFGISYDNFRVLPMQKKMKYIRDYARQLHPNDHLWWIEESDEDAHSIPLQVRIYTHLRKEERDQLRAEAALVCPDIVKTRNARGKYDKAVMYLLTYHGVYCPQARDLFSAGSVANPHNDDSGGLYIARALRLIEDKMRQAASYMEDAIFVEYWGESVPPQDRISRWLQMADQLAGGVWVPSQELFC